MLEAEDLPAAVARLLPQITHPLLLEGVTGVVRMAADCRASAEKCRSFAASAAKPQVSEPPAVRSEQSGLGRRQVFQALHWIGGYSSLRDKDPDDTVPTIRQLGGLAAGVRDGWWPESLEAGGPPDSSWPWVLPSPGALAWRAASQLADEPTRTALVAVLAALADAGLTEPSWRLVHACPPPDFDGETYVFRAGRGFISLLGWRPAYQPQKWPAVQYSPDPGEFSLPPGWTVSDARPVDGSFGAERITAFCALLAERGPVPWRPAAAAELAELTGLTVAESALLLAGLRGVGEREARLPADVRDVLGLSPAHGVVAKRLVAGLDQAVVAALSHAAMPDDVERLWSHGPDVAAVADEWIGRFDRRTPVDIDTLSAAAEVQVPVRVVQMLASERHWQPSALSRPAEVSDLVRAIRWLAYRLPADGPLRGRLPAALAGVRAHLADPLTRHKLGDLEVAEAAVAAAAADAGRQCDSRLRRLAGAEKIRQRNACHAPLRRVPAGAPRDPRSGERPALHGRAGPRIPRPHRRDPLR